MRIFGPVGTGAVQQIVPRSITVKDLETELAQDIDPITVVLEHGGTDTVGGQ